MDSINSYLLEVRRVLSNMPANALREVVLLLHQAWKQGKQVFIFGNGGSASTASHMANDLSKATIVPGKRRMRVIALTDNISIITAWANDGSFEDIFKEQLQNLLQPGDIVIGISASGNSPNVLRAMEFSRLRGALNIGWTGLSGGELRELVDVCIHCPTDDIGIVESVHLVMDHLVTNELRRCMGAGVTASGPDQEDHNQGTNGNEPSLVTVPRAVSRSA